MFTCEDKPSSAYPKLKGKAGELRHIGWPLFDAWSRHMDSDNDVHQSIALALRCSARAEDILDENHTVCVMPEECSNQLKNVILDFLCLFQFLHRHFSDLNPAMLLFSVTIKAHMLAHSALTAHHLSPVFGWCFMGEDFMRLMRKLAGACCRGNAPAQATRKLTDRWTRAVDVSLRGNDIWK